MNYQRFELTNLARQLGFNKDPLERVCRLVDVLDYISNHPLLKDLLALKGGTAINLAVFDMPRLSLDIDLDFTLNIPRKEMLEKRHLVIDLLEQFLLKHDYLPTKDCKHYYALDSLVYRYTNSAGNIYNLKIEINYVLRCHILETIHRQIHPVWVDKSIDLHIVNPIEIFAGKINALLTRTASRDLYDFNTLIKADLFNEEEKNLLRKCAVFYHALNLSQHGSLNPANLGRINQHLVKVYLLPVLKKNTFFDANIARKDAVEYLNKFLILTDKEKQFLTCFQNKQYRPELLFDDQGILNRIINHPMAIWKCTDHIEKQL